MENSVNAVAGILVIACGLLVWLGRIGTEINEKLESLSKMAPHLGKNIGELKYIQNDIHEIWLIARQRQS